jgi:hypothetical protein
MTKPTTGVCFFAYNTEQFDYGKLALLASMYVKKFMKHNNVTLITDEGTLGWIRQQFSEDVVDANIDNVILTDIDHGSNIRLHYDSPWTKFKSEFKNSNKHKIIEYTPYDRTLMLDIDYIVQNNNLDYIFDTDQAVTMYHDAINLRNLDPGLYEQDLKPYGIPMLWSTVVYFDKHNPLTQLFFDTWAHVKDNYDFYKFLYGFPGKMYRTDYCVSIAAHILNGMGTGELIDNFYDEKMIYMSQRDDIATVNEVDEWVYIVNNRAENWKNIVARVNKENVHVMNKRALDRQCEKLMEMLK